MAKISNAGFYPAGDISIDEDEFTAAIDSATLTPTTPVTAITDVSGQTTHVAGIPVWALALSNVQDTTTDGSLTLKLIEWAGQVKTVTYTPKAGGKRFTVDVVIVPAAIGGAGGQVAKSSVTFACNGQPSLTPDA